MSEFQLRRLAIAIAFPISALFALVVAVSTTWIGKTFPSFLVMPNGVVASISLPHWSESTLSPLFQAKVVAVGQVPVETAAEVYSLVDQHPAGTAISYRVESASGPISEIVMKSRTFTLYDYGLLFGAYFVNGAAFLATGLLVFWLQPTRAASRALLTTGLTTGVFVTTAADLYGPGSFFRIHAVAEAGLGFGFLYLALVFPRRILTQSAVWVLSAIFAGLVLAYQVYLFSPAGYRGFHLLSNVLAALAMVAFVVRLVCELWLSASGLVRRKIAVVSVGTLGAFLLPGILMAASASLGGSVPLNAGAFTSILFPASLGYAIVKHNLFEIDVLLRRVAIYGILLAATSAAYLGTIWAAIELVPGRELLRTSPAAFAFLNLVVLFSLAPARGAIQQLVDKQFFRKGYDSEPMIAGLADRLASSLSIQGVVTPTSAVLDATIAPVARSLWLLEPGGRFHRAIPDADACLTEIQLSPDLVASERLASGKVLARYEWEEQALASIPETMRALLAELLVPIRIEGELVGFLALGPRRSGKAYSSYDVNFVTMVAGQVALALQSARAFSALAQLNASLERQVEDRTAQLGLANDDVNRSLEELTLAYNQLELSQASLVRADRMATLGRLAAGVAHEVNTPLGAVMNSLKVLGELGSEYLESLDNPAVEKSDHRQVAQEIIATARRSAEWAEKAAVFISRIKAHSRDSRGGGQEPFLLRNVIDDSRALLAHRLRATSCQLDYVDRGFEIFLKGEAGHLGQVIVNLVGNSIDAYEDSKRPGGLVQIEAVQNEGVVEVRVRDWAGGIPDGVLEHIFDELFTTKSSSRGTGLGLWISRNLVVQSFAGTLAVSTEIGVGTCFTVTIPPRRKLASVDDPARKAAA